MNRRMYVYLSVLVVLLAVCAVWSVGYLADQRAVAREAAKDLTDCRRLADRIQILRHRPAMAADRERQSAELSGPIEQAARDAGIPTDRLVRISPEPARRLGESAYKEKPTRVSLRRVALKNLVTMIHALTDPTTGLDLKSLRLTATSRETPDGTWSAELVFIYLIYEPSGTRL